MNVQLEKLEHNMALLTIEVAAEDFEDAVERAYKKNKNKINMPGFRRGKVSRMVIEKMYGKDFFYGDAVNDAIADAYEKAYDECAESLAFMPYMDGGLVSFEAGMIKPDPHMYTRFLEIHHVNPEACAFVDDTEENVAAARELGFSGIVFRSYEELMSDFK